MTYGERRKALLTQIRELGRQAAAEARRMREMGEKQEYIASVLGVNQCTVSKWLK